MGIFKFYNGEFAGMGVFWFGVDIVYLTWLEKNLLENLGNVTNSMKKHKKWNLGVEIKEQLRYMNWYKSKDFVVILSCFIPENLGRCNY